MTTTTESHRSGHVAGTAAVGVASNGSGRAVALGVAAALVVGGVAAWRWTSGDVELDGAVSPKDQGVSVEFELARMQGEIEALKRRPATPPAQSLTAQLSAAPATGDAPAAVPQGPPDMARLRAEAKARVQAARERMEVELESQPRDRTYERTVEDQLEIAYEAFSGTRFISLECRSTLCKVTSQHDSREAMSEFTRDAAQHPPFNTEVFYSRGDGEAPTTTLYVARPGSALPHDF
jgi:hypothetical protein